MSESEEYTVYAIRCTNDAVDRHVMSRRSVWKYALADIQKFDATHSECGPHTLMSAVVTRSPWVAAMEPDDSRSVAEMVKQGAMEFDCPQCGVGKGAFCENLVERRYGRTVSTSWPHPDRMQLWRQQS